MKSKKTILILGDVAIDHLYHTHPQQDHGKNWQLYTSLQTTMMPGGAFLMAEFVRDAVKSAGVSADVAGQIIPPDLYGADARKMIQARVMLEKYK